MKKSPLFFLAFLASGLHLLFAQSFPVNTVLDNGPQDKRINFVFLGDGYTETEIDVFNEDVKGLANDLFATTPFQQYQNFFNVFSIEVSSKESGADHPGTATDVTEPAFSTADVDTYFGSTYDFANIHRLLVPTNTLALETVLATNFPAFDQAFVVVNSPNYGGSGGFYATSSTNESAPEISIHEIGHSFVGLSDEYWAGDGFAAETQNMTQESDPEKVKWSNWVGTDGVGVYSHGSTGLQAQYFRPHQNCKMRFLGVPFCWVCTEAIVGRIYSLVSPIDDFEPQEELVTVGDALEFTLDIIYPEPNTLTIQWILNGEKLLGEEKASLTLLNDMLEEGSNTLTANVIDETPLSRAYLPESGFLFAQSWKVEKGTATSVEANVPAKFFAKIYPVPSSGPLTLRYFNNTLANFMDIDIKDMQGRELITQRFDLAQGESELALDTENLAAGVYLIEMKSKYFQQVLRFVKE